MQSTKLTFDKYPFLKELGLSENNKGVYRAGQWVGGGDNHTSTNPSNHESIAHVKLASVADY